MSDFFSGDEESIAASPRDTDLDKNVISVLQVGNQ